MTHRITVLYFTGCPNHPPVVEMAHRLIAAHNLDAVVEEVELTDPADAESLRFLGSPTVQVDGVDIEPAARVRTDYAMSCRIYQTQSGAPTRAMLLDALGVTDPPAHEQTTGQINQSKISKTEINKAENATQRAGALATVGSVLTAMLSSACCWLPLTLIAFGVSAGGLSVFFQRWRPYFITLSVVMLGVGFYFAYFRTPACDGGCCSKSKRRRLKFRRATLWATSAVVLAFVFFPNYGAALVESVHNQKTSPSSAAVSDTSAVSEINDVYVFDVQGMTCKVCAVTLKSELAKIPGVSSAKVGYTDKTAQVNANDPAVIQQVETIAKSLGYTASLEPPKDQHGGKTP